jgi:hypothetical protein
MEAWPPCEVVGQYVDHDSHQEHQSANPEERRMMNALPVTLAANRRLWRASLIIFLIHMRHSIVSIVSIEPYITLTSLVVSHTAVKATR